MGGSANAISYQQEAIPHKIDLFLAVQECPKIPNYCPASCFPPPANDFPGIGQIWAVVEEVCAVIPRVLYRS